LCFVLHLVVLAGLLMVLQITPHLPTRLPQTRSATEQQIPMQQQQQQQRPAGQLRKATYSQPLPWRALHHLNSSSSSSSSNAPQSPAPAYLISAFFDTRPIAFAASPRVAVIMAVTKHADLSSWQCLLSQQLQNGSTQQHSSSIKTSSKNSNNEEFLLYDAVTVFCDLPAELDGLLASSSSSSSSSKVRQELPLQVTVVAPATSQPSGSSSSSSSRGRLQQPNADAWVSVLLIPTAVTAAEQHAAHAAGIGSVAICGPVVHTDAYAATIIE
jgi:hypothetical protein